jgi:hypothetical protein
MTHGYVRSDDKAALLAASSGSRARCAASSA